jgi:hypothetical protein
VQAKEGCGLPNPPPLFIYRAGKVLVLPRLCLTNSFVTSVARRGEGKASVRKSLEAYYQYVEDDSWTGNAAIAGASPYAAEAICQTEPSSDRTFMTLLSR